jgi:SOS-response transcriptional repressor LexA
MSTKKYTNVEVCEIHSRLKTALGFKSSTELASRLGTSLQNLKNREERGVNKLDDVQLLCSHEGLSCEWVMTGKGDRFQAKGGQSVFEDHPLEYGGFRKVGVYAMAGAGPPNDVIQEEPIEEVIIPAAWNRPSILPIKVRGKSMEETIAEGAFVGVDREDKFIVSGKVYAVWLPHEGAVIKRLFLDMERITLKSDNPTFPDIFVPLAGLSEHFIQGRVAWVIQKL